MRLGIFDQYQAFSLQSLEQFISYWRSVKHKISWIAHLSIMTKSNMCMWESVLWVCIRFIHHRTELNFWLLLLGLNQSSIYDYYQTRKWPSDCFGKKKRSVKIVLLKFTCDKSFHWYSLEEHKFIMYWTCDLQRSTNKMIKWIEARQLLHSFILSKQSCNNARSICIYSIYVQCHII